MTISNEALEAAARAIFGDPSGETWALQLPEVQARSREDARLALEAAAGIIRAEALEDAADAIDEDPYDDLDPFYAGWLRNRAENIRDGE